jgi:hypothetical protein
MQPNSNGKPNPDLMAAIRDVLERQGPSTVPDLAAAAGATWADVLSSLGALELVEQVWSYEQDGMTTWEVLSA